MMDTFPHPRGSRGRGGVLNDSGGRGRPLSRNKQWVAGEGSSRPHAQGHPDGGERWERGAHHGRGRGRGAPRGLHRKFPNATLRNIPSPQDAKAPQQPQTSTGTESHPVEDEVDDELPVIHEPVLEAQEERDRFYQELVAAREQERKQAIAEGKMDDPLVPKRLEDAISIVGTCPDMCPRFERYRRERQNNLFEWETVPGTKRVDHQRAVKMYERAAGDKTLPSDLRPPHVLKKTLDYLFHDLLQRGGLQRTAHFIRDRSRAVRNDFTMQHLTGRLAIECHDRCARFHILVMHFERDRPGFSLPLEEQQLMNTLQSLKEFYEDQRGKYQLPTELEMRIYHRLIHIRDQRERHENVPEHILSHPVFKLTTEFRLHVQKRSEPITKTSALVVDAVAMEIFGRLVAVLRQQGSTAMVYLVACILERLFGTETIDDIEAIRGDLSLPDIIDGKSQSMQPADAFEEELDEEMQDELQDGDSYHQENGEQLYDDAPRVEYQPVVSSWPSSFTGQAATSFNRQPASVFNSQAGPSTVFGTPPAIASNPSPPPPAQASAFATLTTTPNVFGATFGMPATSNASKPASVFQNLSQQRPSTFSSSPQPSTSPAPTPLQAEGSSFPKFPTSQSAGMDNTNFISKPPSIFGNDVGAQKPSASPFKFPPQLFKSTPATPSTSTITIDAQPNAIFSNPPSSAQPTLNAQAPAFSPSVPLFPQRKASVTKPPVDHIQDVAQPQSTPTSVTPSSGTPTLITRKNLSSSSSSSRTSATPPPLKIETGFPLLAPNATTASPREPPALPRMGPVSLPSTPTTNAAPSSALLAHLKGNLETPPPSSSLSPGFLSPLVLQSPSASPFPSLSLNSLSPRSALTPNKVNKSALGIVSLNGKGKAPAKPSNIGDLPAEVLAAMVEKASVFEHRSLVVKESFQRWLELTIEKLAWLEACRQSDAYREKNRRQSLQNGAAEKKRRISSSSISTPVQSPQKKRARKRVSSTYQPPRTDDELAQRFKENHEEHERRWAQGSFLPVFQSNLRRRTSVSHLPSPWHIWLSMNPESDATAIWVERKFDVPNSGEWVSENVFSIPVPMPKSSSSQGYPGIVVFECTPIEGVDDDIEKKYRILDDCTRLREVIKTLPNRRHYIPSLLILNWASESEPPPASDFFAMVDKLAKDRTIKGYQFMYLNAKDKDPDRNLETSLDALGLDVEGELVRSVTSRELHKHFLSPISGFITEWVDSCSNQEYFNWKLYNLLVQTSVALINSSIRRVAELCEYGDASHALLPEFEDSVFDDSDSAYESVEEWLSDFSEPTETSDILLDLQSHHNIDQDFPSRTFLEHLVELSQSRIEQLFGGKDKKHLVMSEDLNKAVTAFEATLPPLRVKLSQRLNATARRSPKRRSHSVDTSVTSHESKRARLSASSTNGDFTPFSSPYLNGNHTPSPSQSTASLPASSEHTAATPTSAAPAVVTAAMLRALTKDLKKKYIRPS